MRIALLGYGKMGKAIEKVALERGHEVVFKIDLNNADEKQNINKENVDVVIEFSSPHSAYSNLEFCMKKGLKTVCGTTGWLDSRLEIEQLCQTNGAGFFYASNYSIGVNLFFKINELLAKLMAPHSQYEIFTSEIHHTEKLDAPSGTAITIAEGIMKNYDSKKKWVNNQIAAKDELAIWSSREGKIPGTHAVKYISEIDEIEIKHTAYTRMGFALGAVLAAEWINDKVGVYGMNDLLSM
ncbi:MAG TPA: 4-hydroxy-tetrahydrodipicolinate reductase [Leadbetterella sp.]|nr:4-hydroxy-tetrahydrodipicolinate reductase [Leadbetterella sp.]